MTCVAVHEGQNCKFCQSIIIDSYCTYICIGLEYQEDLKLRAINDATARKDQDHLEVRLVSIRINEYLQTNSCL
jgi:hypothetical protein